MVPGRDEIEWTQKRLGARGQAHDSRKSLTTGGPLQKAARPGLSIDACSTCGQQLGFWVRVRASGNVDPPGPQSRARILYWQKIEWAKGNCVIVAHYMYCLPVRIDCKLE